MRSVKDGMKPLLIVLLAACGAPTVPEVCPSLRAVGSKCCPDEVNMPECEGTQAWICEPSWIAEPWPTDGGSEPVKQDIWSHNGDCVH
jgi:hypothetical protein